jgi:hypothetical protein
MASFAHVINPVTEDEKKNLFIAQAVTFNSCIRAREYFGRPNDVSLYTINERANNSFVPAEFTQLPPLTRNLTHVLEGEKFKFPFITDIMQTLYDNSTAEYLVYTALDITMMPFFYTVVEKYINEGHDAIVINRRRIYNKFLHETDLDLMYAESGKSHSGYDTFVFKRDLWPKFIKKDICIGAPPFGNDLFYNMFAFAEKPVLMLDKHLTFHLGMELNNGWANQRIIKYNYDIFYEMLRELEPYLDASKLPWSWEPFLMRHFIWLMNPTLHYPTNFKADKRRGFKRTKRIDDRGYHPNLRNRFLEVLIKFFFVD